MAVELSRLLAQKGLISPQDLRSATEAQAKKGGDLGRLCVNMGLVDEKRLAAAIAEAAGLPYADLSQVTPTREVLTKLPLELAAFLCALPLVLQHDGGGNTLWVAMANPLDESARLALQRTVGGTVKIMVAGYREISTAIARYYEVQQSGEISLDGAEDDGEPIKITNLGGHTLFTMEPAVPAAPPIAQAAPRPAPRSALPPPVAAPPPPKTAAPPVAAPPVAAAVGEAAADDRRAVELLREALQAVVGLCLEKGLFTREELAARLKR